MLRNFALAVLLIVTALPVSAGFKEGVAAYERGDYATAFREFKALAERGGASAQFGLGVLYDKGRGVPKNYKLAVEWYRKAAVQGYAKAQVNLSAMYSKGQGVPKNDREAVKWSHKAAEQGVAKAQLNLGIFYATGKGVQKNYVLAYMWYMLAAIRDEKTAINGLILVNKRMTRAEVAKAKAMAAKWKPKKAGSTK